MSHYSFHFYIIPHHSHLKLMTCVTGRGFNNLSQVIMARHTPTGQLVAVKQTNLDECTEEELLQLMVSYYAQKDFFCWLYTCIIGKSLILTFSNRLFWLCLNPPATRMKFCCLGSSVTPTCWPLDWCSAPAVSFGSSHHSWPMVSCYHTSVILFCLVIKLFKKKTNKLQVLVLWMLQKIPSLNDYTPTHTSLSWDEDKSQQIFLRMTFSSILFPLLLCVGSADTLLRTYFPDGMSESLIAYLLYGVLKALEYLHRMGYVHRSVEDTRCYYDTYLKYKKENVLKMYHVQSRGVKASHILLSGDGRVYLSGLHSVYSMMREGKRMRAVFDMPHHSPALLPWLSPELLRQVRPH